MDVTLVKTAFVSTIFLICPISNPLLRKGNRPRDVSFGGNHAIYFYLWHGGFELFLFASISALETSWS